MRSYHPMNMQVVLDDIGGGTRIDFQDIYGVFLEVGPPEPEATPGKESEGEERIEALRIFESL